MNIKALAFLLSTASLMHSQTYVWVDGEGNGSGEFSSAINWSDGMSSNAEPGSLQDSGSLNFVIQTPGLITNHTTTYTAPNTFNGLFLRFGATMNISADLTLSTYVRNGQIAGYTDTINHTAGIFTLNGAGGAGSPGLVGLEMSSDSGNYNLSGTGAIATSALRLYYGGRFNVSGAGYSVNASDFQLGQNSILSFTLGSAGAGSIIANSFIVDPSQALLNIDASAYAGTSSISLTLVDANSFGGQFATNNINVTGVGGRSWEVIQNIGGDLVLNLGAAPIPEPGSFALLAGLGCLGFVGIRRRRKD